MLVERLQKAWRDRDATDGLRDGPVFESSGLVLGAGTVLAKADDVIATSAASKARLNALLAAAYGGPPTPQALNHINAAATRWRQGDAALAGVHLALSRLGRLADPAEAARRLFIADGPMKGGVDPDVILEAMETVAAKAAHDVSHELRVLPGNGRPSGEWTTGASSGSAPAASHAKPRAGASGASGTALLAAGLGSVAIPGGRLAAGLDLGAMSQAALGRLATFLVGAGAAALESGALAAGVTAAGSVAVLGVLFIPDSEPRGKWISVGGPSDLSFYHNPDELAVSFRYRTADGVQHTVSAFPDPDGNYRGPDGKTIARWVKRGAIAGLVVSTAAFTGDTDQPKLCPAPKTDRYVGDKGKAYENYMKALFNPGNPTPSGMAYYFTNLSKGGVVAIDDCQQRTGALAEYKGPGYERMLEKHPPFSTIIANKILKQATAQSKARGGRPLIWFFAEKKVADRFRKAFNDADLNITVVWLKDGGR